MCSVFYKKCNIINVFCILEGFLFLSVFFIFQDSESLLVKLSGSLAIKRVVSPNNLMWIGFKSDNRINKAGFWLYVQPIFGKGKFFC